ncbi:MAG: protein kinase [Myxococcota bacterium]
MGPDAAAPVKLLAPLPSGGMAVVWRARLSDGTAVAFKRLRPELLRDPDLRQMFQDEARLCERLVHPHIVRLLKHGEDGEGPFLAFELVDGADLREVLAARGRPLTSEAVHVLARALLGALGYAHGLSAAEGRSLGVVHRDVSPSNVLLSRAGEVKLADFGVAASGIKTHQTRYGELKGKCAYMSPEQTQGGVLTASSDLFSLGIVLWECATCRPLFDRATDVDTLLAVRAADVPALAAERPELPGPLTELIHQLLQREPEARPASALDALQSLDARLAPPQTAQHVRALVDEHLSRQLPVEVAPAPRRRRTRVAEAAAVAPAPSVEAAAPSNTPPPVVEAVAAPAKTSWLPAVGGVTALGVAAGLYFAGPASPSETLPPAVVTPAPVVAPPVVAPPQPVSVATTVEPAPVEKKEEPAPTPRPVQRLPIIPPRTARPAATPANPVPPAAQGHGTLDLNSEPWAEVLVDDQPLGANTPLRGVRVAAGRRRITFRNPVLQLQQTVTVDIANGERRTVSARLVPEDQ